jgi:hypothetical protein
LNFVIALMGEVATARLRGCYADEDDVRLEVVLHKKSEFEIDGERFCYQQCLSDRPGFNIVKGDVQRPIVHAYCAMGLEHQHECQQVVLARCTSYAAAAVWVHACMALFPNSLTRYVLGDCAAECTVLWERGCASTLLQDKVLKREWKTFGSERWMADGTHAYQVGKRWELFEALLLSEKLKEFEASTLEQQQSEEPVVVFSHARWRSHVRPTEICLHPNGSRPWRGHLHLSGVDHILDELWMRWRKPSLIVNFVDLRHFPREDTYVEAIRAFQSRGTYPCLNLAWSNVHDRLQAVDTFRSIANVLEASETNHVIFHCRNGKDRSAFGVLALLQVHYKVSYEDAMLSLHARSANGGRWPLVHLKQINKLWWDWLEGEI